MKITKDLSQLVDQAITALNVEHLEEQIYSILDRINARGVDKRSAVATAVYVACRDNAEPITLHKVCKALGVRKDIVFKLLKRNKLLSNINTPEHYIDRLLDRLGLPSDIKKKVHDTAMEVLKHMPGGSAPLTKAVVAVYLACNLAGVKVTQTKLEELTGVAGATMRELMSKIKINS